MPPSIEEGVHHTTRLPPTLQQLHLYKSKTEP